MIKRNQTLLNTINVILDGILIPLSFLICFRLHALTGNNSAQLISNLKCILLFTPFQLAVFSFFQLYTPHRKKNIHTELWRLLAATTLGLGALFTGLYLAEYVDMSRPVLLSFWVTENILLGAKRIALRMILRYFRSIGFNQKHVIVIGCNAMAKRCVRELHRSAELGYQVHGYVADHAQWNGFSHLGEYSDLPEILNNMNFDEVFVCLADEELHLLSRIIDLCEINGVRFSFIPYYSQFMNDRTQMDALNGIPILNLRRLPLDFFWNAFWKRSMDIVISLLLIILTSPLMAIIAIGVRLSSPGPIIFRQERVGYDRKLFHMYKFRSMRINASQETGWTTDSDPRKTSFGAFIRKYSLDELPQFFNVLRGNMSLVGPRPEVPHYVEKFKDEIPLYMIRHQVRPGITGWAQVNGLRGDTSIAERVKYDRWYINHWSVGLDLAILLRTVLGGFVNRENIRVEASPTKKEEKE